MSSPTTAALLTHTERGCVLTRTGFLCPSPSLCCQICLTSSVRCLRPPSVPLSLPRKKKKNAPHPFLHYQLHPSLSMLEMLEGRARQRRWDVILSSSGYIFERSSCVRQRRREWAGACVKLSLLLLKFICLYFIPHFSSDKPAPRERVTYFHNTVPPSFSL